MVEQLRLPLGQSVAAQVVREARELIGDAQVEPFQSNVRWGGSESGLVVYMRDKTGSNEMWSCHTRLHSEHLV